MKKILFLMLFCGAYIAGAQSLIVESVDTSGAKGNGTLSHDLVSYINIKNIGSKSIDVKVKRIDANYTHLTDSNAICWDVCFSTVVSVSPTTITIAPGQTTTSANFVGHVYPDGDGYAAQGPITYIFFDENNPIDSVAQTINYAVTGAPMSTDENYIQAINVYPNPASDVLNVEYHLSSAGAGSFELVNVIGSKVYERKLSSREGNFKLDISQLARGVYFYLIKNNGDVISTRKLVIR